MKSIDSNLSAISDEKACAVLSRLHAEARRETWKLLWKYLPYFPRLLSGKKLPWERLERTHGGDYLASTPGHGRYLYLLARAIDARRIVEFGTSFGVSTIYLALAVRNAAAMKGDHVEYVAFVRDPSNGFVSSSITLAGELSVRVAGPSAV